MNDLKNLLSPITIKNMTLANRCVMPPMGTGLGNRDGSVSDANLAYTKRRAASGVGLVITEIMGVHPSGTVGLAIYDDMFMPGLKKLANVIHQAGVKGAVQLHHGGREAPYQLRKGMAVGPSAIPSLVYGVPPKEMSRDDIQTIIASFGQAAARAKKAGFDAVELHGAHGYLLAQFLSEISNQREDEYGGSFKDRARFVIETVAEVRKSVGGDYPILLRISAEEYIQNGFTVADVQSIVPDLEAAGVDVLHASIGTHGSPGGITSATAEFEEGWNAWRAEKIKAVTDIPVIAVGRFSDPRLAEKVIAEGKADMVAFGRQILADPDFLIKARKGRYDDIRKCLACNQGCIERLMFEPGSSVRCAINPETGQELIYPKTPPVKSKTVWIIGGGPAGLTAADEAARLGHRVTLFEKEGDAGGQVRFAGKAPGKTLYQEWIDWLIKQVHERGVEIKTGSEVTGDMLEKGRADMVVIATGGKAQIPDIKGLDQPMVCEATQILDEKVPAGKNVVIIGGGLIGMETADFLVRKGSQTTIVEILERSPVLKMSGHGYMLHKRLRDAGCTMIFGAQVDNIAENTVDITVNDRQESLSPVDQVVLAVGMEPRRELIKILEEKEMPHVVAGDAVEVRRIIDATDEGAKAAWKISILTR